MQHRPIDKTIMVGDILFGAGILRSKHWTTSKWNEDHLSYLGGETLSLKLALLSSSAIFGK